MTTFPRQHRLILIALAILYVSVVIGLNLTGHVTFFTKSVILIAFMLCALLTGRFFLFVNDWILFISFAVLFDTGRGLIYAAIRYFHWPVYSQYAAVIDRWLCFGHSSVELLQQLLSPGSGLVLADKIAAAIYGSHFVYFLLIGLVIWLTAREQFSRYALAFLILMYLGLLGYLLVPTVPPWLASEQHLIPTVKPTIELVFNTLTPTLMKTFDTNPIAAMPSLHAAFATLGVCIMVHIYGKKAWWLLSYVIAIYLACILLAAHYSIDLIVGSVLAVGCYWLVFRTQTLNRLCQPGPRTSAEVLQHGRSFAIKCIIAVIVFIVSQLLSVLSLHLLQLFFHG